MSKITGFDVPKDMVEKTLEAVTLAQSSGKLRKGVNETTKAVERGIAKLVVVADDTSPEEILMHLPLLCAEKTVPLVSVPTKAELGKAAGIPVGTSSIAITEEGEGKPVVADIAHRVAGLKK